MYIWKTYRATDTWLHRNKDYFFVKVKLKSLCLLSLTRWRRMGEYS